MTVIRWRKPDAGEFPPFNERILVLLQYSRDQGRGFKHHQEIRTLRVMQLDCNGDGFGGKAIAIDLKSGAITWEDAQFMLHDDEGQQMSAYSDCITWWAPMPVLPLADDSL